MTKQAYLDESFMNLQR